MAIVEGFVVQAQGNHFLNRRKTFSCHKDNAVNGIERAYVHSEQSLLRGGPWTKVAVTVVPARYDPTKDQTEVLGEGMTYEDFLETRQPAT